MKRKRAPTREPLAVRRAVPENRRKSLRPAVLLAGPVSRLSLKRNPPHVGLLAAQESLKRNLQHAVPHAEQAESNLFGD